MLTADHFQLLSRFYQLLDSIEEGFYYIVSSFENINFTERDQVLADVLLAIYEIDSTRSILLAVLSDDFEAVLELKRMDFVIDQLEKIDLESVMPLQFQSFMKYELLPSFLKWKKRIQEKLKTYVTH